MQCINYAEENCTSYEGFDREAATCCRKCDGKGGREGEGGREGKKERERYRERERDHPSFFPLDCHFTTCPENTRCVLQDSPSSSATCICKDGFHSPTEGAACEGELGEGGGGREGEGGRGWEGGGGRKGVGGRGREEGGGRPLGFKILNNLPVYGQLVTLTIKTNF